MNESRRVYVFEMDKMLNTIEHERAHGELFTREYLTFPVRLQICTEQ